jgi:hypothetical protein
MAEPPSREQPVPPATPGGRPARPVEDARAKVPVDDLGLKNSLLQGLKAAGILTVDQLERELRDEAALETKVYGCGPKSIALLKTAIQLYGQQAGTEAPAIPATSGVARREGNSPPVEPKKAMGWVVVVLVSCMGVVLILALGTLFLTRMQFNESQLHGFNLTAAVITAVISYVSLGYSRAAIEGSGYGFKLRIGGPLAGALCVFLILTKATPTISPRSVFVRLVSQDHIVKVDFDLTVRAPGMNQFQTRGTLGEAILQIGWHINEVDLDVSCAGYKQQGSASQTIPADGIVRIQMKADADIAPALPDEFPAEAAIPDLPTNEQAALPGQVNPRDVTFRYKNDTGRNLKLQVMSVSKYYKQLTGEGLRGSHWSNWPFPANSLFQTFDKFQGSGSGWFCFFVAWEKQTASDPGRCFLATKNLFETTLTTMEVVETGRKDRPYRAVFGP